MAHIETGPIAEPESVADDPVQRDPGSVFLRVVTLAAAGAALLWAVVAVLCASRGLDITDESFYLLSYRWWDVNYDTFTGAQYFYGPIFELLGHDIADLRIVKSVMLLMTHAAFGWAFMRWLRLHRPDAPATHWWEAAGTAAIVACGGIVYSWLPLSPGYNDLALNCALLAGGAALRITRDISIAARPPWWAPFPIGALAVVMVLGKWSSSVVALTVIGLAVTVVAVTGQQGWLRFLQMVGFTVAGALVALGAVNFLLVPLGTLVPPLLEVNSLVAASSNSPTALLSLYWDSATLLLENIVRQQGLLLLVAVVLPFLRGLPRLAVGLALLAVGVAVLQVLRHNGLEAGPPNLPAFTVTIFTPLLAVALAALASAVSTRILRRADSLQDSPTRDRIGRWAVFGMLLTLPIAQAAGTGNPVHFLAMTGLGVWMAAAIAVLTSLPVSAHGSRTLIGGTLAWLVLATSLIAVDGLWNRPYRTTGHDVSTAVATDVPALSSIRLDPTTAEEYAGLRDLLEPYVEPSGRAMMGFDGLAGVVLLLDGRPVGEAWYSGKVPSRSAAGIRRACEDGDPWWGDREPLVFFNRPVTRREHRALRACGLSLRDDYRLLTFAGVRGGDLDIYVPNDEKATD